jgi:hypothetical protein
MANARTNRVVAVDRYRLRDGWPVSLRLSVPSLRATRPMRRRLSAIPRVSPVSWTRHRPAKRSA